MKIREVVQLLSAKLVTGENQLEREINHAFSSNLMRDVLTIAMSNVLLITRLANIQTISTDELSVRDKGYIFDTREFKKVLDETNISKPAITKYSNELINENLIEIVAST